MVQADVVRSCSPAIRILSLDKISRPSGSGGGGSKASNTGEGLDEFVFELSREEFLEFFFEDLELPDMIKTKLTTIVEHKWVRAGYSRRLPANINVVRP